MTRGFLTLPDIRLSYVDWGGDGPGVLLLHGLMGTATTWASTARWLVPRFRVVALDQRGHGWSDKPDGAYTRDHYVSDAAATIEALGLAPAVVIGHSMGALNAWVLAARHPHLVRALVLVDQGADTASRRTQEDFRRWFATWPVPFPSLWDVRAFFQGPRPGRAEFFMEIMAEGPDGWRPRLQFEHMLQSCADWDARSYWDELRQVRCPTLIVRGAESWMPKAELEEMARTVPGARFVEIPDAGHLVHLEQPVAWRVVVERFLDDLPSP